MGSGKYRRKQMTRRQRGAKAADRGRKCEDRPASGGGGHGGGDDSPAGEAVLRNVDDLDLDELRCAYKELYALYAKKNGTPPTAGPLSMMHTWVPYVKVTFLGTLTALFLFMLAERQYSSGYKVGFGVLSAIGGASVFLAVPATHWIGRHLHSDYKLFQPFQGGTRFVVLQGLSWTFYSITALIVFASVAYADHTHGLLASAGVIGILSQVFMVSSLLTYTNGKGSGGLVSTRRRSTVTSLIDTVACAAEGEDPQMREVDAQRVVREFANMNTGLVLIGITLAVVSDSHQGGRYRLLFGVLSLCCCTAAIFLTYGIGGLIKHRKAGWSFAQVFRGGKEFVLLQIAGWCLFGIAVIAQGFFIASSIYVGTHIPGVMYVGAAAAVASQYVITTSLRRYEPTPKTGSKRTRWNYRELPELSLREQVTCWLVLVLFCNTQFISFGLFMVLFCLPYLTPAAFQPMVHWISLGLVPQLSGDSDSFTHTFEVWRTLFYSVAGWTIVYGALTTWDVKGWRLSLLLSMCAVGAFGGTLHCYMDSPHHPMLLLICSLYMVYISTTFTKKPESNACREWFALRNMSQLSDLFERFFGLELHLTEAVRKVAGQLGDPDAAPEHRQVMLLFHPHSIFPLSHVAVSLTRLWRTEFPYLSVNPLTASIIHLVPAMRDVLQWLGVCDVAKESVAELIGMGRNVQIVCGGQTEMFESRSWDPEIVVVRKRRLGVFRIAIQNGLGIVPVYSFGETLTFDNVYMPRTQAFFRRIMGIPMPFFMIGNYGLPVPRRVPISVAVGAPVHPRAQKANPSREEVVEFQERYFAALEQLFEEHKERCGHGDCSIKWLDN